MRMLLAAIFVAGLVAGWAALPCGGLDPAPAQATHGRICGAVAKGSRDYLVVAKRVGCRRARKGVSQYLKRGKPLPGFSCRKGGAKYAFVCHSRKGAKAYRAERL